VPGIFDSATGRFLSEDPTGFAGGQANLYVYVGNDPINFTDPFGLRPLTACEKQKLAPYIPKIDLDKADLHDGEVPWYLGKDYAGITRGNDIYFRPGVYDPSTIDGLAVLGHELVHVGQYRKRTHPASLKHATPKLRTSTSFLQCSAAARRVTTTLTRWATSLRCVTQRER
jgi:uncharacterized protein RhaS with RHS repeats